MKENKGKIVLNLSSNLQYVLNAKYDTIYDCSEEGCDDEGMCRCGVIEDPKIKPIDLWTAVVLAQTFFKDGKGVEGNFGLVLANRFLKHLFADANEYFKVRVRGGYYGDEIEGIYANPGAESQLQDRCDVFNNMTNSERVKLVLEMEYGHLLPDIDQYNQWKLVKLPIEDVHADKDVLNRLSSSIVESYVCFTPGTEGKSTFWKKHKSWFPGIVVIPRVSGGYRVVDGFHRYQAWTKKPYGVGEQKWKKSKVNKKIKVIAPVE